MLSQLLIRKSLITLKYNKGTSLEEHYVKFDGVIRDLKTSGAKPDNSEIICYLLLQMPESYQQVVTAIETMKPEDQTLEFVKNRLLAEETKKKEVGQEESVSTAFFNKTMMKPYFRFNCYNCGQIGHKKADCKYKGARYQHHQVHSSKVKTFEEEGETEVAFILATMATESSNADLTFIVDSGATDHLINTANFFHEQVKLRNPIKIHVAKANQPLEATRIGNIKTENYLLKNVLYVKDKMKSVIC